MSKWTRNQASRYSSIIKAWARQKDERGLNGEGMAVDASNGNGAGDGYARRADRGYYRVSRLVWTAIEYIHLFFSGEEDYALSSGQVSPIC